MAESEQYLLFDPLSLRLPIYEGPFEALLELIRKKKLSVYSVKLADICAPYLEYLKKAREIDLELGAEFISMASTLILIKSRSLLPKHEIDDESEDEEDLNQEEKIRKKLIELEIFEQVSAQLGIREKLHDDFFPRPLNLEQEREVPIIYRPAELSVFELIKAFKDLDRNLEFSQNFQIDPEPLSLQNQILELIYYLQNSETVEWEEYFDEFHKVRMILLFLSMLELAQKGLVDIFQNEPFSPIQCRRSENFEELFLQLLSFYRDQENTDFF